MNRPVTAIILLNWNGADDTIACIESLLRMSCQDFFIVVCDNSSADDSFMRLQSWGRSNLGDHFSTWSLGQPPLAEAKVILIQTGANLGFAGGCNVGLRYARFNSFVNFLWLLNNDTVVEESALTNLLEKLRSRSNIGMTGATISYFDAPAVLQAAGGYDFNFWTARVLPLLPHLSPTNAPPEAEIEERLKYISGASIFLRREFLEEIGLLNEQYFLYFEEIDWATRSSSRWALGYCSSSRVFHKEGRSIGSHRDAGLRSSVSERYLSRNRVLFMRTYFPWRLAVCLAWLTAVFLARLLRANRIGAENLWRGVSEGLCAPIRSLPAFDEWPASMGGIPDASMRSNRQ